MTFSVIPYYRFCNKKKESVSVVNRFYLAIMYRIYKKWKENDLTIHDSCFLLKGNQFNFFPNTLASLSSLVIFPIFLDVEKWCRAHPRRAFSRLEEYLAQNVICNGLRKRKRQAKKTEVLTDDTAQSLSWLDLTKPSLEVFI